MEYLCILGKQWNISFLQAGITPKNVCKDLYVRAASTPQQVAQSPLGIVDTDGVSTGGFGPDNTNVEVVFLHANVCHILLL